MNVTDTLDRLGIQYKTEGKNISMGWVGIPCPYCNKEGNTDPSTHMGISKETGGWSCWRDNSHRGRNLAVLIAEIKKIPVKEAKSLINKKEGLTDDLMAAVNSKLGKAAESDNIKMLEMPKNFYKFQGHRQDRRAGSYMIKRGFPRSKHLWLSDELGIRYCYTGRDQDRIIFPVYEDDILMTWTGRSFYDDVEEKYKNLPKSQSVQSIRDCLLFHDYILHNASQWQEPEIFICEGPFDALKFNLLLPEGLYATCLFGLSISERQSMLLNHFPRDTRFHILLDSEYEMQAIRISSKAKQVRNLVVNFLPNYIPDPGDITSKQLDKFLEGVVV